MMIEFVENPVCPQCLLVRGNDSKLPMSYCPGDQKGAQYQRDRCPAGIEVEHLHVSCGFCQFSWASNCVELPEGFTPPPVPLFSSLTPCFKCGFAPSQMHKPSVFYCPGGDKCVQAMEHEEPWMHRSCVRCNHRWIELPHNLLMAILPVAESEAATDRLPTA